MTVRMTAFASEANTCLRLPRSGEAYAALGLLRLTHP